MSPRMAKLPPAILLPATIHRDGRKATSRGIGSYDVRMNRHLLFVALTLAMAITAAAKPAAREIPGITGKDVFPRGCVDCHTGKPGNPVPLSAVIKSFSARVDPKDLARLQAFAPKGLTLKGKHPPVPIKDVPANCFRCHAATKSAPPFAALIHGIHLTGGETNPFLTKFGGECTHCHKFNAANGQWSIGTGSEK